MIDEINPEDIQKFVRKYYLTNEEFARTKDLWKLIEKSEKEEKLDADSFFEMVYLGFLKKIQDRKIVEEDLRDLHKQLNECANKMTEILEKSKFSSKV